MVAIYGHRGAMGTHPENTLISFSEALKSGVDGIELDVQMTKDGELVVIHDPTVDRTTDGSGFVQNKTLEEIKQLSAGIKFHSMDMYDDGLWPQIQVPTLREVLELIQPYGIELNIELKPNLAVRKGIEEAVLTVAKQYGSGINVIYSSFHLPMLMRLRQLDEHAVLAWLLEHDLPFPQDYSDMFGLETFHLSKKMLLAKTSFFEQAGMLDGVRVWTVNKKEDIEALLSKRVKAIMTDFPKRALELRKEVEHQS